ncbi:MULTISPECIES: VOC family protein [unclassified Streptomyces]|uniref:VOC family protein n=1 Tax=unclassified Streptomyces TaxID=2593676 RepID=UPI0028C46E76|nr:MULTISPECIES: VOC family protein [unclassified Streptomyces]WNO74951.1 VOC family protein [Streptomyces sp. AM8-1-1]
MEWTLEVVILPVADLDRSRGFYEDTCGFAVDTDTEIGPGMRIVQLTPPGSRCSIALSSGLPPAPGQHDMAPGSVQGLQLCVTDIYQAHAELLERGVEVSNVQHVGASGSWEEGRGDTWNAFMFFKDPDGNGWVVQEAPAPLSER